MIPLPPWRTKGAPLLGATGPGQSGPFGRFGAADGGLDEDDDQDDEQQA